jgi:predicted transcriptional regulator
MDQLWSVPEPQTVHQVHEAMSRHRRLAYSTILTILQRLVKKDVVVQYRDDRAHRFAAVCSCDHLVAALMIDALNQEVDLVHRRAVLANFVERVGSDGVATLRRALGELVGTGAA